MRVDEKERKRVRRSEKGEEEGEGVEREGMRDKKEREGVGMRR